MGESISAEVANLNAVLACPAGATGNLASPGRGGSEGEGKKESPNAPKHGFLSIVVIDPYFYGGSA